MRTAAPWLPPMTRTRTAAPRLDDGRGEKPARSGTPYCRIALPRKLGLASSHARKARLANGARRRFASPTVLLGSSTATGTPRRAAASVAGPDAYPPTLRAARGRSLRTIPAARSVARMATMAPRMARTAPPPFIGSTSIRSSRQPPAGTTRASTPRSVPTKTTSTSASAWTASATATAGKTCPPVPPPAMSKVGRLTWTTLRSRGRRPPRPSPRRPPWPARLRGSACPPALRPPRSPAPADARPRSRDARC